MTDHEISAPCVYIIDDDVEILKSLQWLFESVKLNVVVYDNPLMFLNDYQLTMRGCLLIDVRMPGMNGMELLEQLKIRHNRMPIIMLTGHGDIPMAVRAMKFGAQNFISKPFNDQHLLEEVQRIVKAEADVDPTPDYFHHAVDHYATLNEKERMVLKLVVRGMLNKQIADELGIAVSTVELYRARIKKKMNVKTTAQLIRVSYLLTDKIDK